MINGVNDINIELYAYRSGVRHRGVSFLADVLSNRGELVGTVKTVVIEDVSERELYRENPPPLFDMSNDAAQKLFDQLYDLGFRQSDVGSAGHLKATEKHLEDMRKIAFGYFERAQHPFGGVVGGGTIANDKHEE
jgi:hypothetical protein